MGTQTLIFTYHFYFSHIYSKVVLNFTAFSVVFVGIVILCTQETHMDQSLGNSSHMTPFNQSSPLFRVGIKTENPVRKKKNEEDEAEPT